MYIRKASRTYKLLSIEKTLLNRGFHTSWVTVREALRTHQVNTVVLPTDARELRICRGSAQGWTHRGIYAKLDIEAEVIPARKTWS